jgi:hypothetical protein
MPAWDNTMSRGGTGLPWDIVPSGTTRRLCVHGPRGALTTLRVGMHVRCRQHSIMPSALPRKSSLCAPTLSCCPRLAPPLMPFPVRRPGHVADAQAAGAARRRRLRVAKHNDNVAVAWFAGDTPLCRSRAFTNSCEASPRGRWGQCAARLASCHAAMAACGVTPIASCVSLTVAIEI